MPSTAMDPQPGNAGGVAHAGDRRRRRTGALLLLAEALLLLTAAGYCLKIGSDGIVSARFALGIGGFLLVMAIAVGAAARSLAGGGRYGIGFGITWQMFQALVGASMLSGGLLWQGALALLLAISTFVVLLNQSRAEHERALSDLRR